LAADAFQIRRMTAGDLADVLAIERACFAAPWSRASFLSEIDTPGRSHPLVVQSTGGGPGTGVVGYACLWRVQDELWINNLAVHRDFRRRGLATRLLREALRFARQEGCAVALLEVRPSNAQAVRLYRSEGFEAIGRRPRYYSDNGEDALVMAARLRSPGRQGWRRTLAR